MAGVPIDRIDDAGKDDLSRRARQGRRAFRRLGEWIGGQRVDNEADLILHRLGGENVCGLLFQGDLVRGRQGAGLGGGCRRRGDCRQKADAGQRGAS